MTPPLRPILHSITERGDILTLRDAVSWYKNVVKATEPLGDLTVLEQKYVNGEWAQLVKELAEAQGIPAGMLSYWLNELATNEITLARAAAEEAAAAMEYPSVPEE